MVGRRISGTGEGLVESRTKSHPPHCARRVKPRLAAYIHSERLCQERWRMRLRFACSGTDSACCPPANAESFDVLVSRYDSGMFHDSGRGLLF